jgi:hypothetical protein
METKNETPLPSFLSSLDTAEGLIALLKGVNPIVQSPDIENAISSLKEDPKTAERKARQVFLAAIRNVVDRIGGKEIRVAIEQLTAAVKNLDSKLNQAMTSDELGAFLVRGTLKHRYEEDEHEAIREAKMQVARYVAQTFFKGHKKRSFIQASITAIHLGRELERIGIVDHSLFVTNSVVFPLILLQGHARISVRTFCGDNYDPMCGGWLPRRDDDEAYTHLRRLFDRSDEPLSDSFITPIGVAVDCGDIYVTHPELAHLLGKLLEYSNEAVIMTTSSRIFGDQAEAQRKLGPVALNPVNHRNRWTLKSGNKPTLVIARDMEDGRTEVELSAFAIRLVQNGFDVRWQHNNCWSIAGS